MPHHLGQRTQGDKENYLFMKIFKVLKNFYGFPEPQLRALVVPKRTPQPPEKCKQWEERGGARLVTTES